jgi:hypothetical protein
MAGLFAVLGVVGWVWSKVSPVTFVATKDSPISVSAINESWQFSLVGGQLLVVRIAVDVGVFGYAVGSSGDWRWQRMTTTNPPQYPWVLYSSSETPAQAGQPGSRSVVLLGVHMVHPVPFSGRPRPVNTNVWWMVMIPLWQWSLMWGSLAVLACWRRRVWWRRLNPMVGMCTKCGYDLRASPERCPECGTVVEVSREGFQDTKTAKGDTKGHERETPT